MRREQFTMDDPRIELAIEELKGMVLSRYPEVCFEVTRGDDPAGVYLTATVDVEDVDEVMELYTDQLIDLQVEDGLPLYVLSLQPFERIVATLEEEHALKPRARTEKQSSCAGFDTI